jgi:hypothetical protein
MATLTELGRNSASVYYSATAGADTWLGFQLVDQWIRNDTLQGYALASGTTVTGTNTIFTTQVRAGDVYSIAGQVRTVLSVSSDTSMTVTSAFSPAITAPSAIRRIDQRYQNNLTGKVSTTVRGNTTGTVSCLAGSTTITGVGTNFFSELTQSATLVTPQGTVAVDTSGNITGTNTIWTSSVSGGIPTVNSLQPGDSIVVTSGSNLFYMVVATVTSDTAATVVTPPPLAITSGATLQKVSNGVVGAANAGRIVEINGRMRQVTGITNNTSMTVNSPLDFTDSNIKMKVYPRGTITSATGVIVGATNVTSVATAGFQNIIVIPSTNGTTIPVGSGIQITAGVGILPVGTYIAAVAPVAGQVYALLSNTPTTALSGATLAIIPPTVTANNGGFIWDVVDSDNIWVQDENRAFNFNKTLANANSFASSGTAAGTISANTQQGGASGPWTATITLSSGTTAGLGIGSIVTATTGVGTLAANSIVHSITSSTVFVVIASSTHTNGTITAITSNSVSVSSTVGLAAGMSVVISSGTGTVASGTTISSVSGSGAINLSNTPSVALSSATIQVYSNTTAVTTDSTLYSNVGAVTYHVPTPYNVAPFTAVPYRREDSYLTGVGTSFTTDLRVNDEILINGTECTVTQILSDTSIKLLYNYPSTIANGIVSTTGTIGSIAGSGPYTATITGLSSTIGFDEGETITATAGTGAFGSNTFITDIPSATSITIQSSTTPSAGTVTNITQAGATVYKKQKIHGYVLEGTREGTAVSGANVIQKMTGTAPFGFLGSAGQIAQAGATQLTVAYVGSGYAQYNFIKIQGAGGPATPIRGYAGSTGFTGSAYTIPSGTALLGSNTYFTQDLHVGAEICVGGQYLTVASITSDTLLTTTQTIAATHGPMPIYRTVPLYTYIAGITGNTVTLGTPLRNTIYSPGSANNPPLVNTALATTDFIEYVYSAPNYLAQYTSLGYVGSNITFNQSLDRKYVGYRYFPLWPGNAGFIGSISGSGAAYAMPVYERWTAAYGQTAGVGINLADQSGGVIAQINQASSTGFSIYTGSNSVGTVQVGQQFQSYNVVAGAFVGSGYVGSGFVGSGTPTYTTNYIGSVTAGYSSLLGFGNATDVISMYQNQGGFVYMFAQPTYFILQGKSASNVQLPWIGVVEFERAQPEDQTGSSGLGTTTGVAFSTIAAGMGITGVSAIPGVAPWPTYGYVNGNRFATGASTYTTSPINTNFLPTHGAVISVPRVRASTGDLVGANAHIYSAFTITTGRWGHLVEFPAGGAYLPPGYTGSNFQTNIVLAGGGTLNIPTLPQPHMGQLVPVYTNVYNSKRFMFSPVVVLGPAYDPDIRGRLYSLKVIPSNLGTLMDTVSVLVDSNFFYSSTGSATDHWVITASVITYKFTLATSVSQATQAWRSLEDTTNITSQGFTTYTNSFRWAIPT